MRSKKLLVTLAIFLFYLGESDAFPSTSNISETCDTKNCHEIADAFLESMNKSADPCVDFNEFVCGSWKSKNLIPKYESAWSRSLQFQILVDLRLQEQLESISPSKDILPVQQAKKWYQSCMNHNAQEAKGLDSINAILQSTSGWPMVMSTDTWNERIMSWQNIDEYYEHRIGENVFYTVSFNFSTVPPGNVELVQISPSTFPMEDLLRARLRDQSSTDAFLYRSIIRNVAKLFIEKYETRVSDEELEKDIDDLIEFEKNLYKAHRSSVNHKEEELYYKDQENISHLNEFIRWWNNRTASISTSPRSKIDWYDLIRRKFDIINSPLNETIHAGAIDLSYFSELVKVLDSANERTIVNYIQWWFLSKTLPYTTDKMKDIFHEIVARKYNIQERRPRWRECIYKMKMDEAAAYMFFRKYYSNNTHQAVQGMIKNIKQSLKFHIENSNWLSNKAITVMKEKLDNVRVSIGYPDWLMNDTAIIDYYKGLIVGDDYLENGLNFMKYENEAHFHPTWYTVNKPWDISLLRINAHYDRWEKDLFIPGVDLQPPLFESDVPDYINYGTLGSIIAHEMGHAVNDAADNSLLDDAMRKIYFQRLIYLIHKFDRHFTEHNLAFHSMNHKRKTTLGRHTLRENFADWIGIGLASHSYKEMRKKTSPNGELKLPGFQKFTDEQMFFISYGQAMCAKTTERLERNKDNTISRHSPAYLRIIGTLSNNPAFTEAFNCPRGSPMNPENKLDFW